VSETMSETAGKIAWFELPAGDTTRAQEFYGRLFGWQFQPFGDQDYHVTYEPGGAIYGAPGQQGAMVYFGTDDIDAAIARVRELGGEAGDKQEIPDVGLYATCSDTEGNAFGLYQSGGAA
jgi:predicted enzyme related to lactoylglutathione lyase